jgi:hypothetical protein
MKFWFYTRSLQHAQRATLAPNNARGNRNVYQYRSFAERSMRIVYEVEI